MQNIYLNLKSIETLARPFLPILAGTLNAGLSYLNTAVNYLQGWLGDPHESGDETFLSSNEMDSRPLGSSEQFSGIISSEPDFSIMLAGGASRSISISDESEVDAAAFKEPEKLL